MILNSSLTDVQCKSNFFIEHSVCYLYQNFKFSLCKPKYKTVDVPVFSKVVDDVRIDLSRSIGNIFKTGVDKAISANRSDQQFEAAKQAQGYVPAIQAPSDSLSASELEQIRKAQQ